MRGSRLRGEHSQVLGQRGPRREISHRRSDGGSSEGPGWLCRGLTHTPMVPTLPWPASESCQEGKAAQGEAGPVPAGLSPSLRSGWWDARDGGACLCAPLALSQQGHAKVLGNGGKALKGTGTPHSQGQVGEGGTRPMLLGSTDPAAIARSLETRATVRQLSRHLALQTPPPRLPVPLLPAPAPLPPYLPGARVPAATPPWPWLRAQGRTLAPCLKNRPSKVSSLRLPARGQLQPVGRGSDQELVV